jgi:hypothetical protein
MSEAKGDRSGTIDAFESALEAARLMGSGLFEKSALLDIERLGACQGNQ